MLDGQLINVIVTAYYPRCIRPGPGLVGALDPRRRGRRPTRVPAKASRVGITLAASDLLAEPLQRLQAMLDLLNARLPEYDDSELSQPLQPGGWSRRQILGHLIDSAVNNHRRFVLCQLEPEPYRMTPYEQNGWVRCGAYQMAPADELLQLWTLYNRQLARLLATLTPAALLHRCEFENGYSVTLGWLIEDYVVHLEHHVRQIIS